MQSGRCPELCFKLHNLFPRLPFACCFSRHRRRQGCWSLARFVLALGIVPATGTSVVAVVVGLGGVGLGVTWAIVGFVTERQLRTPPTLQGRVAAASTVLLNLPQLLITVVGAALVGVVDYRALLVVTVAGIAVAAVLALRGRRAATPPR